MRGAGNTIASVMPVSTVIIGGIGTPGFTNVSKRPSSSPPRMRSAPISVIASVHGDAPVVSRSTTTNVTSDNGMPRSSRVCWRGGIGGAAGAGANPDSTGANGEVGATGGRIANTRS